MFVKKVNNNNTVTILFFFFFFFFFFSVVRVRVMGNNGDTMAWSTIGIIAKQQLSHNTCVCVYDELFLVSRGEQKERERQSVDEWIQSKDWLLFA